MSRNPENTKVVQLSHGWRVWAVLVVLFAIVCGIAGKMTSLYVEDQDFLQKQGDLRTIRTMVTPAHRGVISDRNGEPLAVSAPVAWIWADPASARFKAVDESLIEDEEDRKKYLEHKRLYEQKIKELALLLDMNPAELKDSIDNSARKHYLNLRRHAEPELADKVRALNLPGIIVDRDYRRFYPAAEVASHLVGFTNSDGIGIEGLEKVWQDSLLATPGKQLVMRDLKNRTIKNLKVEQPAINGQPLKLTIDLRLQYLAYRELKAAVTAHKADTGMLVMLDAKTGEILAMVNQPSYNPNDSDQRMRYNAIRNRAMTDIFEPGSTMKPLSIAAALMSGKYHKDSTVDTSPGVYTVMRNTPVIRDHRDYGVLDLTGIITKSSNVGTAKVAMSLAPDSISNLFIQVGLGQVTAVNFPGESSGSLPMFSEKQKRQRASQAYGYGLNVTPLQLAQAYLPFANNGVLPPVSLVKGLENPAPVRVMSAQVARNVLEMMETVVSTKGTARLAAVPGYRVAGKTGTVHKVGSEGYSENKYQSIFAGVAPVSDPRIVMVVVVDDPKGIEYYGGLVAAPVFSKTMEGALRVLNVAPDAPMTEQEVMVGH